MREKAFTLMEMLLVIIIVGLLSAIAFPKFFRMTEQFRSKEGYRILWDLYGAQKRYAMDNADNYTSNLSDLDVEVRVPQYFQSPVVVAPPANIPGYSKQYIVRIAEKSTKYTLYITPDGKVACVDGVVGSNWCSKAGYKYPNQI